MTKREYDFAIVGAGPAGLFAAHELTQIHGKDVSILLIDQGENFDKRNCPSQTRQNGCVNCNPCSVSDGIMGAGLKSDGKLHFHPEIIGLYGMGIIDENETNILLQYVENLFESWGLDGPVYPISADEALALSESVKSLQLGDNFQLQVKRRTRHAGSDKLPGIARKMLQAILGAGNVEVLTRTKMIKYENYGGESRLTINNCKDSGIVVAKEAWICLGRKGSSQVQEIIDEYSVSHSQKPVEIGGRIELDSHLMKHITDVIYNPCFNQRNQKGQGTYTFCANPNGWLSTESLLPGIPPVVGVNGEGRKDRQSAKTNFAVLTELPIPDNQRPNDFLTKILRDAFGGRKPIVQTTLDFINGTMNNEQHIPDSTLRDIQYANIAEFLPGAVIAELRNFLTRFDQVVPGAVSESTNFILPEAKIRGIRIDPMGPGLKTNVPGLRFLGESSGFSGGITSAAITGVYAARNLDES